MKATFRQVGRWTWEAEVSFAPPSWEQPAGDRFLPPIYPVLGPAPKAFGPGARKRIERKTRRIVARMLRSDDRRLATERTVEW